MNGCGHDFCFLKAPGRASLLNSVGAYLIKQGRSSLLAIEATTYSTQDSSRFLEEAFTLMIWFLDLGFIHIICQISTNLSPQHRTAM